MARASAKHAISLDPNEPLARFAMGRVHMFAGEAHMAIAEMQSAVATNPNLAQAHYGLGVAYLFCNGEAQKALPHFDNALRLSPRSPLRWMPLMLKGEALNLIGRAAEAVPYCRQACQFPNTGFLPHMHLAQVLVEAGHEKEAKAAVEHAIQLEPAFSIGFLREQFVNMHETRLNSLLDSLRKAGAPVN